jgi:CRP-like cAMP-binding protein
VLPAKNPGRVVNRLLGRLPEKDQRQVLTHCELVDLEAAEVLSEPGDRIRYLYFPTDSYVSLTTPPADHPGLGVRLVGREGMIGTPLILDVEVALLRTFVQGGGHAWRMTAERFREALRESSALRTTLNCYLYVVTSQIAHLVACTRFHLLEARLARSLLVTQDRAHADYFHVTHDFLASMLGVRRVGVTKAASRLQRDELIGYRRGDIRILDRPGLIGAACCCYRADEALYERILGTPEWED